MLADNILKNKINCFLFDDNEVIIIYTALLKETDPKDPLPEWLGLFNFLAWPEKKITTWILELEFPHTWHQNVLWFIKCDEVRKKCYLELLTILERSLVVWLQHIRHFQRGYVNYSDHSLPVYSEAIFYIRPIIASHTYLEMCIISLKLKRSIVTYFATFA